MPRTPVLALTSDWHLQQGAWKRANTPQGDSFFALDQIVAYCVEHRVDLLGAGDLFDDLRPDTATLERAYAAVARLRRANQQVLFTQGQHEKAYPAYLGLTGEAQHVSGSYVNVNGIAVYGMDHVPADRLEAEAAKVPGDVDVLMCHQVWSEFMGLGAEGSLELVCKAGGPKVVLTGDYHKHIAFDVERVYSPGSTCLQAIDEPREKAFYVLYSDLSVESVPLRARAVLDASVDTPEGLERLLATLPDYFGECELMASTPGWCPPELARPLIYVTCRDIDQAFARVSRAVGQKGYLFWKPMVGEAGAAELPADTPRLAAPRGLVEVLPSLAPVGSPVHGSVLRLLGAPDPKAEVAAMAAEFGR